MFLLEQWFKRDIITWGQKCQSREKKPTTHWDGRVWIRHTIAFLELPKPARSLPFFSTILNTDIWWAFRQQVRKEEGYVFTLVDRQSWKGHLRWMDVDGTRRQVQTPDRLGQIPAPHWASSKLIPDQVQFPPCSTEAGRIRRRIHLTMSCSCRIMQVRGHMGRQHPRHRATDSWNKTRHRSGKTPGERRHTHKPGRCLGHCPYLRSHEGTRPATGNTSHSWGRTWRWHKKDQEARRQSHEVRVEPWRYWQMPSAWTQMWEVRQTQPLGTILQDQTKWSQQNSPSPATPIDVQLSSEWWSKDTRRRGDRRPWDTRISDCQFGQHQRWQKGAHASLRHVKPEHWALSVEPKDKRPTALKAKVDTGAQANILPLRIYRQMDLPEIGLKRLYRTIVNHSLRS